VRPPPLLGFRATLVLEFIGAVGKALAQLWSTPTGTFGLFMGGIVIAWLVIIWRVVPRLPPNEPYDLEMELFEHLEELRTRLIRAILYLAVGAVLCWFFYNPIYTVLTAPIRPILEEKGYKLVFMTITEAFFVRLQVCLISGLVLASPPILAELWGFIVPALTPQERKPVRVVMPLAILLFCLGVGMAYVVLPAGLRWFAGYIPQQVELVQRMSDYLLFMVKMCLGFGLAFELPVVLMLLGQIGLVRASTLTRYWRQAVVIIMLIAAILTPSNDPFTMLVLSAPMALLYLGSISLVRMVEPPDEERERRRRRRRKPRAESASEENHGAVAPRVPEEAGASAHQEDLPPD
jgi:sec-independent protein translocase protein TatC